MVRTQATTRFPATPQRTAESRLEAPTPMTAVEMVWVVLMGAPSPEAPLMTRAAAVSARSRGRFELEDLCPWS